jgi:hypothetical protein
VGWSKIPVARGNGMLARTAQHGDGAASKMPQQG